MDINTIFLVGLALVEFGIITYLFFKVKYFQKKLVKDFNIRYYFLKKQGESNQNHVGLNYFW